jgi:HAD superfamily phosphatase (TIGR01668 family)
MVEAIWAISPENLVQTGVRALLLDLDNTLVDWNEEGVRAEVLEWTHRCRRAGLALCICTNARRSPRVRQAAAKLGACYLCRAGKPFARAWKRALFLLRAEAGEVAVIGDQVFTDIWGANRLGMKSILVKPLSPRDFFATKIPRLLEKKLLTAWRTQGRSFRKNY